MRYHEIAEASSRKPTSPTGTIEPMTPEESRREAERKADITQRINQERTRSSQKIQELQAKLTRRP
jgi:hypothetical protein